MQDLFNIFNSDRNFIFFFQFTPSKAITYSDSRSYWHEREWKTLENPAQNKKQEKTHLFLLRKKTGKVCELDDSRKLITDTDFYVETQIRKNKKIMSYGES